MMHLVERDLGKSFKEFFKFENNFEVDFDEIDLEKNKITNFLKLKKEKKCYLLNFPFKIRTHLLFEVVYGKFSFFHLKKTALVPCT